MFCHFCACRRSSAEMSLADELWADLNEDGIPEDQKEYVQVKEITGDDAMDVDDQADDRVYKVARLVQSPEVSYKRLLVDVDV